MLHRAKRHPNMRKIHNFTQVFRLHLLTRNALISLKNSRLHDSFSLRNFLMSYIKVDA